MKGFLISLLAAGTVLLLAALFWPSPSRPRISLAPAVPPIAAAIDTIDPQPMPERYSDPPTMPRAPASVARAPAISFHTDDGPASEPIPNYRTMEPTADAPRQRAGAGKPSDPKFSLSELQTIEQSGTSNTSLRNADFPRTYIRLIQVDLASPNHSVQLTWAGPQADRRETGPFHSSPGRGLGNNNCDDVAESNREDSNCTPKGTMRVQGFSETMATSPECRFVTWFNIPRGVAFHYYPTVPNYPASHGCVRLRDMHAAQLIHNNSKIGETEVIVSGKWTFVH